MNSQAGQLAVLDAEPATSDFLSEVISGLSAAQRTLPCKFFYDERGASLFQRICDLPEYYITRTELAILRQDGPDIASHLGVRIALIGLGTGPGTKTRILLENLRKPIAYIPVDISRDQLQKSATLFQRLFPQLEILPVCADYLESFDLPTPLRTPDRNVIYFPGSTIGNFEPRMAIAFLRRICGLYETKGSLLIGVDLQKDRHILERAYNDSEGVTAEFNLNLLLRANHELGANFDLKQWRHEATYNAAAGRIEMHLVSEIDQNVHIADYEFRFRSTERIITEFSYKYTPESFTALAAAAGLKFVQMWTDKERLFGVFYFICSPDTSA
jgi:dimethylhistidine N-methyltransferase